jgi:hypothetical protein
MHAERERTKMQLNDLRKELLVAQRHQRQPHDPNQGKKKRKKNKNHTEYTPATEELSQVVHNK